MQQLVATPVPPGPRVLKDGEMNQNTDAREQAEAGPGAATVPAQAAGGQAKAGSGPARHDGGPAGDRQTDRDRRGRRGWVVAGVVVVVAAGRHRRRAGHRGVPRVRQPGAGPAAGTRPGRLR